MGYVWVLYVIVSVVIIQARPFHYPHLWQMFKWFLVGHAVLACRAVSRKYIGYRLRSEAWARAKDTHIASLDYAMWTSVTLLWVIRVCKLMGEGTGIAELQATRALTQESVQMVSVAIYITLNAWFLNILVNLAWVFAAPSLEEDLKGCAAFRTVLSLPDATSPSECPICQSEYPHDVCQMSCGHTYHRECLASWAQHSVHSFLSCPMCRSVVEFSV